MDVLQAFEKSLNSVCLLRTTFSSGRSGSLIYVGHGFEHFNSAVSLFMKQHY
jgi:hypothetical protein